MKKPSVQEIQQQYSAERRKKRLNRFLDLLPFLLLIGLLLALWFYHNASHRVRLDENALTVFLLDVGQGDSVLIHTPTNNVLIDAGEFDQGIRVVRDLDLLDIDSLDYVINSHPHSDHIGGMADVLDLKTVHTMYMPDIPEPLLPTTGSYLRTLDMIERKQIPLKTAHPNEILDLGIAQLRFLAVDNSQFDDLNNCSLGCLLTYGNTTFFFGGDLESAGEKAFLDAGLIPPVTVLKCSHHGSNTSGTERFLQAAMPSAAVISVGAGNDYGHPAPQMLARLRNFTDKIFRTDTDGTIQMVSDGNEVTITTKITLD